ncbi:MAG: putative transport system permease protein [Patescibacteria group bacterium]|nr:putative transport system permease protein [Patescibacteria group bacterium]
MLFSDLIQESSQALLSNKTRSGLTILGIVIGIASVIAMISIGQGTQDMITSVIEGLGSNLLTITPGAVRTGIVSAGRGTFQSLKNEDVTAIEDISGVQAVVPEVQRRYQVISSVGLNTNTLVVGTSPDYLSVRNANVKSGAFFTENQNKSMARVAVLGATAAEDLFGDNDPLGKTIRINKINFKVIGVLEEKGGFPLVSPDYNVFVPVLTMQKIVTGTDYLTDILVSVENSKLISQIQELVTDSLARKHNVDYQSLDFTVTSQADILSSLNQIINTFTFFLASIAGISLLVGGIGIMNMMLTTVTERTHEIGLRKAVGAKKRDITLQFLSESIILTVVGGIIGIICGWLLSLIISKLIGIVTAVSFSSVLLACGVSTAIGMIFGYYPAQKAANLNPIDALRYE